MIQNIQSHQLLLLAEDSSPVTLIDASDSIEYIGASGNQQIVSNSSRCGTAARPSGGEPSAQSLGTQLSLPAYGFVGWRRQ